VPREWTCLVLLNAAILSSVMNSGTAWATPEAGFTATKTMSGAFPGKRHFQQTPHPGSERERSPGKGVAVSGEDNGTCRPLRPEQCMAAGRKHRLAHLPWAQPCHRRSRNRTEYQQPDLDCKRAEKELGFSALRLYQISSYGPLLNQL
jgi:hypothetical protein